LSVASSSINGLGSGFEFTISTTVGEITGINVLSGGTNYTPGTYVNSLEYIGVGTGSSATVNSVIASEAFEQIVDPDWQGANYVTVLDSQFIFTVPNSNDFVYSAPNQLLPLSAGGFSSKSGNSDNINGQFVVNRQLWLLGTQTGEIWVDQPNGVQAFQRTNGPYLQQGCAALFSTAIAETPNGPIGFFVSQSPRGGPQVYVTNGLTTTKISTQVIDQQLMKYGSNISTATGFTYQYGGHIFYQLNPTNDDTSSSSWVYDYTTSILFGNGIPLWHERTFADSNGQESRDLANNHCMLSSLHLVR